MTGDKKPTIKDVSKIAGVSTATVSRYLNSSGYVDDYTAQKIKEVISKINYSPNKLAKGLKTNCSLQIMLVVPNILNPYYGEMYKVIQNLAHEKGYTVILYDTNEKVENEITAIKLFGELGSDGMIFCSIDNNQNVFNTLKILDKPIVVSNQYEESIFDTLHSVGGKGIYIAAKHLIEIGHRKIAYVGGPEGSAINKRRKKGFLLALEESDIALNKDWCFEMDFSMDAGYKAGIYISSLKEMPSAVCAANDVIAMGVMLAFNECGIRIPDDISITGEDNIEFAKVSRPGLTTVNNSGSYFAVNAMKMLFERIDGIYSGVPREVICPRELVIRDSTRKV